MSDQKSCLIDYNAITIKKKLGQGGFGEVHQGIWYGTSVAVKQLLDADDLSKEAKDEFVKEAEFLATLKAPNIIQYFGFCVIPKYSIVMEYMPKGSLYSVNKTEDPLPWSIRMRIATDMANGMLFLNDKKILHRDIKSLNVLLDENYKAKLCDFGLARVKTETKQNSTIKNTNNRDSVGTVQWMAPELFTLKPKFTPKSDIYSLGITFWELAARKIPYYGIDNNIIPTLISRGEREEIPEECPAKMAQLIRDCWETNPDKRPDAKTIVERLNEGTLSISTNEFDLFKYLDISPGSQKVDDYKSWAIRMRPLPNDEAVCGFGDGSFKIFNMRSGKLVKSVQAHSGRVWDCTMYQNKYLITTSQDKSIKFWDKFGHGSCVKTFTYLADVISACDISNEKFAVAASDSKVTIWNFNTGKITNNLTGHSNVVQCLVYIKEKNILASSAGDAMIFIWSLDTFTPLKKLSGHTKLIFDLRKLSNNFLISSCDDYTAKIWDPLSGKCVMTLVGHKHFVNGTTQLSNGNIVTSSEDTTIKIWDYNSGKCLRTISCHAKPVWGLDTLNVNEEQINILSGDTRGEMYFTRLKLSS